MQSLTMPPFDAPLLGLACRIFLEAAYTEDPLSVPAPVAPYGDLPAQGPPEGWSESDGVYQALAQGGFALRLGSRAYPHLKLRVHWIETRRGRACLFAVDTHDAFSREASQPPADHPEAAAWQALQQANRALKEKIETAWETAGLLTLNGLLREALENRSDASDSPTPVRN